MNLHQVLCEALTFLHGNYLRDSEGRSYGHLVIGSFRSCIPSSAAFFGKTSNRPGDSAPLQPRFSTCNFSLFPKLNLPLKGKRFQIIDEIQGNTTGQLTETGRAVRGPRGPLGRGLRRHRPVCSVSCVFSNCLYFHTHGGTPSGRAS